MAPQLLWQCYNLLRATQTLHGLGQRNNIASATAASWAPQVFPPKCRRHCYIQFSSVAQSCPTLCDAMNRSTPGLPVHHQRPESTQTHAHWIGDAIQPSHPLSPFLFLPPMLPSIRVFSNESVLRTKWPKYWSVSFNISPSNEHPGLISFRMDWLDLLAVQGTLKSFLQHHNSKASILRCSILSL